MARTHVSITMHPTVETMRRLDGALGSVMRGESWPRSKGSYSQEHSERRCGGCGTFHCAYLHEYRAKRQVARKP